MVYRIMCEKNEWLRMKWLEYTAHSYSFKIRFYENCRSKTLSVSLFLYYSKSKMCCMHSAYEKFYECENWMPQAEMNIRLL